MFESEGGASFAASFFLHPVLVHKINTSMTNKLLVRRWFAIIIQFFIYTDYRTSVLILFYLFQEITTKLFLLIFKTPNLSGLTCR
ncbi:MAG TPA: hypothetical protein DIU00_16850 [Phycisphaerales bacterium]|nr:hypothetical protein [Phycisphaerales bacterium]